MHEGINTKLSSRYTLSSKPLAYRGVILMGDKRAYTQQSTRYRYPASSRPSSLTATRIPRRLPSLNASPWPLVCPWVPSATLRIPLRRTQHETRVRPGNRPPWPFIDKRYGNPRAHTHAWRAPLRGHTRGVRWDGSPRIISSFSDRNHLGC
jgi:hypothetical protein